MFETHKDEINHYIYFFYHYYRAIYYFHFVSFERKAPHRFKTEGHRAQIHRLKPLHEQKSKKPCADVLVNGIIRLSLKCRVICVSFNEALNYRSSLNAVISLGPGSHTGRCDITNCSGCAGGAKQNSESGP